MPQVTFTDIYDNKTVIDDADGNLMETALEHQIAGIDADCGGMCSCATCHVKIAPEWLDKVGRATDLEMDVLAYEDCTDQYSRLSCQIELTDDLDGLIVQVAKR